MAAPLGCGLADRFSEEITPVPPPNTQMIGVWVADGGHTLKIFPDGRVEKITDTGSATSKFSAPAKSWDDGKIYVGALGIDKTLVVDAPPAQADGAWTMTVDGIAYERLSETPLATVDQVKVTIPDD